MGVHEAVQQMKKNMDSDKGSTALCYQQRSWTQIKHIMLCSSVSDTKVSQSHPCTPIKYHYFPPLFENT